MEDYDKIKKTLAIAFMHDLDANRPEWKMCLSNGECADIEKAFNEQDWSKLARYLDKYTESEDEIHRKWILEYLYDGLRKADEQFKDHFKSAIDWFKKQKEQKPDIEHIHQSWYMEGYKDHEHNREPKWIVRTGEGGPNYEPNPKYGQDLVKEQKPAEKQDYSGLNDPERAILRGFLCAGFENVPVGIIKDTAKECIAHFPWPTKWSEEDEHMLWNIISIVGQSKSFRADEMLNWLKSLSPQPKQEWSEEDEAYRKSIISTIEMCMKDCERANVVLGCYESDIAWLKRLRPSWKPSEAQKEALKRAIDLLDGEYCDHPEELDSLLNDLNKL